MLHRWALEWLKDLGFFIWKDYSENIHTKKPKSVPIRQDLPSHKSSACGDLSPCSPFVVRMAWRRPWSTSTSKVKKTFAKWCQYLQSTLVLALQIFRDQDLCYMAPQGHRGAAWALCLPHASKWVGTVNGFRQLIQVLVFPWYREMIRSHSIAWLVIQRSKGVLKWKGSLCLLHWDQQSALCCVLLVVKVSHGIYVGSACFCMLLHVVQAGGLHSLAVDHIMCSINFASCTLTLCSIKPLPVGWALRTAE